jgi:hypothetical protein
VEATSFLFFHKTEPGCGIEFSTVEFSAAIQACHGPFDPPDPREFLAAPRTTIEETPGGLFDGKGQGVTARFVGNAEIAAGPAPFRTMGRNPAAPGAKLGQQMGKLVPQSAIEFGGVVFAQSRIQRDEVAARIRAAGGTEEARVPFHVDFAREFLGAESY